ncbi:MAG: hypothetical protein ACOCSL_05890 [Thermoplasmatota archaeon]
MFNYSKKQTRYNIYDTKIGGQPGEYPTLLIGSIFYEGEFDDPKKSKKIVSELIQEQKELSEKTNLNSIVDIFIYEKKEIKWKIDFILDETDGLFSIDIPDSEVRTETIKYIDSQDSLDRVLYNSINLGITSKEKNVLRENPPEAAIVLGYNPKNTSVQGRLDILKNGDGLTDSGLLEICKSNDIKPLIDTGATPFGKDACETLRAIPVLKSDLGLPIGSAPHNVIESWDWMEKVDKSIFNTVDSAIDTLPILLGADFLYYGPIENCEKEFYTVATVNKLVAEGSETYFGTEIDGYHPYHL